MKNDIKRHTNRVEQMFLFCFFLFILTKREKKNRIFIFKSFSIRVLCTIIVFQLIKILHVTTFFFSAVSLIYIFVKYLLWNLWKISFFFHSVLTLFSCYNLTSAEWKIIKKERRWKVQVKCRLVVVAIRLYKRCLTIDWV